MRRLLAHSVEFGERAHLEPVNICRGSYDFQVHQLIDELFAETFDVHRPAGREMQQGLLPLGSAKQSPGTARSSLALETNDLGTADRAPRGHLESIRGRPGTGLGDAHDFRNHVSRPSHDDGVPAPDILSAHFVLIVERGVGDRDAADTHGFEARHRREHPGAANLDFDVEHLGDCFFRRIFVSHGEPWSA